MADDQKYSTYYQAKLRAVENILNDDDISFYKKITRWYSNQFATPLAEVRKMPYVSILQEYYESTLEDTDFNEVYEYAMREMLPEFMEQYEQSDAEFAESLIEEQKRTLERKRKRDMKLKSDDTIEIEEEVLETKKEAKEPTAHETGERKGPKEINMTFDDDGDV